MLKQWTPREDRDLLRMIDSGFTLKGIARHLGCTENRVRQRARKLQGDKSSKKAQTHQKKVDDAVRALKQDTRFHMGRVAMMPCAVANEDCSGRIEVNHVYSRSHPEFHTKDDRFVMPLCIHHHKHNGGTSYHDMKRDAFREMYGVDCYKLASELWDQTQTILQKKKNV